MDQAFNMLSGTTNEAPSGLALPITLALLILLPVLAVRVSGFSSLDREFGQAFVRIIALLGIGLAYIAQVFMIPGALICIYQMVGAYTVNVDPSVPRSVVLIYCGAMGLIFALGFLTLAMAAVYTFEWVLSADAMQKPKELTIIEVALRWSTAVFAYTVERLKKLKHSDAASSTPGKAGDNATERPTAPIKEGTAQLDRPLDEEATSDGDASTTDSENFPAVDHWKAFKD